MLNSDQLLALEAVARLGSFSLAAGELHITQSALSRRIQALESELSLTLLQRKKTGTELTESGRLLFEHVQNRQLMENEIRARLRGDTKSELSGMVRVAGYSSTLRQYVIPRIAPLMRQNTDVQIHHLSIQSRRSEEEQFAMLTRGEIDFLLIFQKEYHERQNLEAHFLERQEIVAIESAKYTERNDTILDARPEDMSSQEFLSLHGQKSKRYLRSYLFDDEGIISGVEFGLGKGLVFKDSIKKWSKIRLIPKSKPLHFKLYLVHRNQPHCSRLFIEVREALCRTKA